MIAKGNAARNRRQWQQAAEAYARALRFDATLAPIHVQHGHALKEGNDRSGAYEAYLRALAIDSRSGDTWLQTGHVLKLLGRSSEAIAAYRQALVEEPGLDAAAAELAAMGARDAIPDRARRAMMDTAAASATAATRTLGQALYDVRSLMARPQDAFDDFRRAYPPTPPPTHPDRSAEPLSILVDGSGALAADIRCTLDSLLDQTCRAWQATIVVDDVMAGHPVASMALVDRRIAFATAVPGSMPGDWLRLSAGTALDPHAIAWFRFAATLGSPAAAYCDHDHAELSWRGQRHHTAPVLQPRFDRFWFEEGQSSPPLIYVAGTHVDAMRRGLDNARILCDIADRGGRVIHVPRLLATIVDIDVAAAMAEPDGVPAAPAPAATALPPAMTPAASDGITIVIPTRDQAQLLERCIATLIEQARFPERLDIVVVDNRSVEDATKRLLSRLASRRGIRTLTVDEPFNWSRANNLAIKESRSPFLVMMNNDTEMLTADWDVLLARHLARPEVGIVGAKLLYPDRTVQHAGILFGMEDGSPTHDGVGASENDPGPDSRWTRTRAAAAVTGAFMGMRREVWTATGGFDELALPIGFNDIDMCLRVRRLGLSVLYASDLLLIHYESKTRGRNVTRSQVAWDRAELRALHDRWGSAMFDDPSLNPHWIRYGIPFHGYREPPTSELVRYMEDQAGAEAS